MRYPSANRNTAPYLVAGLIALHALSAHAQDRPKLHVSTRWKDCSIQLDSSLKQPAWRQFTAEAAEVVYFRPLNDARPMGRGALEFSITQWQTNVDDKTSAWNDTFVHPDSTHWLHEGSGLRFPVVSARAGLGATTDVGAFFTKNPQANYGAYGLQVQQNLIRGAGGVDLAARASFSALIGPADVDLAAYGVDVVASWTHRVGAVTVAPYASASTYLSSSHAKSPVVTLEDEHVLNAMGSVGAAVEFSKVRFAAEAGMSRVPSISIKLGIAP